MSLVENFKDRVPTQVLNNGAIRYEEFDANSVSQGYRYLKRADEPIEPGNIWNKEVYDGLKAFLVPSGLISMWSGAANNIPEGWYLCNGQNGTPDLRNRFVVGAGDEYVVGATGGEKEHILTAQELPAHSHTYSKATSGSTGTAGRSEYGNADYIKNLTQTSTSTSEIGSGQAHENRPPYYALCYIMKA